MQGPKTIPQFKVILVGDYGVGKTTFLKRPMLREFEKKYMYNRGVEMSLISFCTNRGPINLSLWDTSGQQRSGGLREGYYVGASAAILMFDVTARITYKNVPKWYKDIRRICESIPVVLVGNKVDQKDRKVKPRHITFHRKCNLPYFDISVKSNYQYEKPFLQILRNLTGDPNLHLVEPLALKPQEIAMDQSQIDELAKEWQAVEQTPLPKEQNEDSI